MTTRDEMLLTGVQFTDRAQRGGRVIVVTTPNATTSYPVEALQSRPLSLNSTSRRTRWDEFDNQWGGGLE